MKPGSHLQDQINPCNPSSLTFFQLLLLVMGLIWYGLYLLFTYMFFCSEQSKSISMNKCVHCSLQWFGHVSRSAGLAKTILQRTVQEGRRRGWQKRHWENNISQWTVWKGLLGPWHLNSHHDYRLGARCNVHCCRIPPAYLFCKKLFLCTYFIIQCAAWE